MRQPYHDHVVIIGGGFGGLYAAKALGGAPVQVTLIDRRNFHLFQPLLYQVATGGLSPADIAAPLRAILKRQKNIRVLMGEVVDIDPGHRQVVLQNETIGYDALIVSTGASHHYFGSDRWEALAPGLKTIEDATAIRTRILMAFEKAERDPAGREAWLSFVVVGGGPTGVELAGAISELAHHTLKNNFRAIDPSEARIFLLEGAGRVLPAYPPELSEQAARSLERLGATVRTGSVVSDIEPGIVTVRRGEVTERISARTVLWAAGVKGSPLGAILASRAGAALDRSGRVVVEPDLTVPGRPEIFVIGDLACFSHQTGAPLPGVAPVAMQEGHYAARLILARLAGRSLPPFRYTHKGSLATIGRAAAVADFGRLRFGGFLAWLLWLFIHLMYLVGFDNRLLVFIQWALNYFTCNRRARLITGKDGISP
ncbi:MAG: NAD(P)/FAD-dependent oxidoreductase [Armatimonadetes bacterium]|nr:NAD(P)/FAD-dependent oxidoreductase [Armatimonadota bacterium]